MVVKRSRYLGKGRAEQSRSSLREIASKLSWFAGAVISGCNCGNLGSTEVVQEAIRYWAQQVICDLFRNPFKSVV